ncbi:SprT family zinc-dependent metalloprotease [Hymenobacter sp. GOD-10R]|uniref:M48 family metallopeptidase n=1 Tax=Hymenobacter sp. GOD-10R TaxID=3093922 RepID=UPI002D7870F0|nr:SprT family zinc-dependent metalloprotease [Hymenobacter sp. GOD-10R]WRQ30984.1 SprT family zinc-dependent metalloprotease [Hymenobacter sp. GOD-10R]
MPILQFEDLTIEVVRKNIRSLRLTVYAPDGRVRVAAPLRVPTASITEFISARQAWIRRHQAKFAERQQPVAFRYESGEIHFYQGRGYTLHIHPTAGRQRVVLREEERCLELYVPAESTAAQRQQVLTAWYRAQLKEQLPALAAKWEPVVGAQAKAWAIKQMKTRWGTCNIAAKRIWLNLELIKQPLSCLEYVVVHELVHLHERLHNARFWGLMDQFMPDWRQQKAALNQVMLAPSGADAC